MSKQFSGTFDSPANYNVTLARPIDTRAVITSLSDLVSNVYEGYAHDGMLTVIPHEGVFVLNSASTYNDIIFGTGYEAPTSITDSVLSTYSWQRLQTSDLTSPLVLSGTSYDTIESYLTAINAIVDSLASSSSGIISVNGYTGPAVTLNASDIGITTISGYSADNIQSFLAEIASKQSTAITYKGSVDTYDDLPSSPSNGDMYNVTETGNNYIWNSTDEAWDATGSFVDLAPYQKIEDNTLTTDSGTIPGAINELKSAVDDNASDIDSLETSVASNTSSITSLQSSKADSTTVSSLSTTVSGHTDSISSINSSITTINSSLASKASDSDLSDLSDDVTELTATVSANSTALESKVNSTTYEAGIASINTALDGKVNTDGDKVLSTNDYTDADKTAVSNIDTTIATAISTKQNSTDSSLTTTTKTIVGAINELDTEVGTNTSSISSLSTRTSSLESDVTTLETTVGDANSGLVKTVTTNTSSISSLTTTIGDSSSGLTKSINDNTSAISTNTSAISALDEELGELSDAIDALGDFDGSYSSLTGTPTIPDSTSDITNDSDFQSSSQVNTLISTHNTSTIAHDDIRTDISELESKVDALNSVSILNKSTIDNGVISCTESSVDTTATNYISTYYSRDPQNLDGLIITLTDRDDDKVQYVYMSSTSSWVDIGSARTEISNATSTTSGIVKLYTTTSGTATDGSVTQSAINTALSSKVNVDGDKVLSTNDYTDDEKTKLAGIATGAQVNTVTSVAGKVGAVTLTSSDVGLGNVDNTSDADKPVSTATASSIATKANLDASDLSSANVTSWKTKLGIISSFNSLDDNPFSVSGSTISVDADTIVINNKLTQSVLSGSSYTLTIPAVLTNFRVYDSTKDIDYIITGGTVYKDTLGNYYNSISTITVGTTNTVITFSNSVDSNVFKIEY